MNLWNVYSFERPGCLGVIHAWNQMEALNKAILNHRQSVDSIYVHLAGVNHNKNLVQFPLDKVA